MFQCDYCFEDATYVAEDCRLCDDCAMTVEDSGYEVYLIDGEV